MDAGFTLARAHYVKLVLLWLGFAAPVFAFCLFIQLWMGWSSVWSVMFFVWWWFKPLYELPQVMYLSKALFSEPVSLRAAWKMALSQFWLLFKTYLTLARLSTARSLTYSVVFLERLPRKQRAQRIQTLTMVPTRHYLLMMVCFHIEYILTYAIGVALVAIFAANMIDAIDWLEFFLEPDGEKYAAWFATLSVLALLVGGLVAPFYVTGGFLVYINRRMHLEAWDIEHRFRNITPRTKLTQTLALILVSTLLFSAPETSYAQEQRSQSIASMQEVTDALSDILAHEDFGTTKTRKIPTFNRDDDDEYEESQFLKDMREWLSDATGPMAKFIKLLLWVIAVLFFLLLLHTIRRFRRPTLSTRTLTRGNNKDEAGAISHPLTQNLPDDIAGGAMQLLKKGDRRQALSVLFRGALRAVMNEYDMKINKGATESDCKVRVAEVASEQQVQTFYRLLGVWQQEAYANQPQQEQTIASLIQEWTQAFPAKKHSANAASTGDRV